MPQKRTNLELHEVSLVDSPANKGSRVALFKRERPAEKETDMSRHSVNKAVSDVLQDAVQAEVSRRASNSNESESTIRAQIVEEMAQATGSSDDPRARGGQISTSTVNSIISGDIENPPPARLQAFADVLNVSNDSLIGELSEEARSAGSGSDKRAKTAGSPGDTNPSDKGATMSGDTEKRLGDLETQVNQLTKERDALQTEVEKHGLTVTKSDDGTVAVQKAEEDEVITDPDGNTVRKSEVGASYFQMLKRMQDRLTQVEGQREMEALAKRAEDRLPNVGGTAQQKGVILKAVEGIQDEETRNAAIGHLDTLNKMLGENFVEKGHSGSPDAGTEAMTKLDNLAKERAEKTGETKEVAYTAVLKTDQGAQLYDQHLRERAQ